MKNDINPEAYSQDVATPKKHQSFLLVTTSKSLILVDSVSGSGYRIDTERQHYYGITRNEGQFYVGVRYRSNQSPVPKIEERGKILVFDRELNYVTEIAPKFPMRDIHQILFHRGRLWVACSYDNMIAIFDGKDWEEWYPLGYPEGEPRDTNHFNSLTAFDNEICLVAHNLGAIYPGRKSELLFFNVADRSHSRTVVLGNQAHNAWLHNTELMTCSSGDGLVVGTFGTKVTTGGFPRGVAYVNDEIHIGLSEFSSRVDRDASKGQLLVFDQHWRRKRSLQFVDEGMVTDMIPLSCDDTERFLNKNRYEAVSFPVNSD
jgi:hypothetical protein